MGKIIDIISDQKRIDLYRGRDKRFSLLSNGEINIYLRKFISSIIEFCDGKNTKKCILSTMEIEATKAIWDEYWNISIYGLDMCNIEYVVNIFNSTPIPDSFILDRIKLK